MKISFNRIRFTNFMSFGSASHVFEFQPGITHFYGKNGSGKSTLAGEALSFVLFGKPYRKIKIGQLVNRTNKKKCIVEVDFTKNGDRYTIIRGIKPGKLSIIKNGDPLDALSSNKLTQDEINKILGIDYEGFRQIVSIASNNNKSFVALSAYDKRRIIESLFDLQMISEANKLLKQDRYDLKIKLTADEANLNGLESALGEMNAYKQKMDLIIKSFNDEKDKMIKELKKSLADKRKELKTLKSTLSDNETSQKEYDLTKLMADKDSITNEISQLISDSGEIKGVLKKFDTDMKTLQSTDVCPVCKTDITDDHREKEISSIQAQVKDHLEKLEHHKNRSVELANDKTEVDNFINSYNDVMTTYHSLKTDLDSLTTDIDKLKISIDDKKAEEIPTISDEDIDNLNLKIKNKISEYEITKKAINTAKNKMTIIDIAEKIFSDTGIKSEYYNMIVPVLNEKLNEYIHKFEMPVTIMFDNFLNYNIRSIQQSNEDLNYFSFSEGEKKKIDISIMLSFIHMSKMISNWDCNLLFLDEVLDSGIDSDSLDVITGLIKDITIENGNDTSVYVVSHRDINKDIFDRTVLITKDAGFSKVLYI